MPSSTSRVSRLQDAENCSFDSIVIGGGITGACAAWDAATRGLRVLLLERNDFGASTSAQSLKILHGGIRYLQHLDIRRLRESCAERSAFLRMAPHLTSPTPFVVPTYGIGLQGKMVFRAAFALLALLTIDRNKRINDCQQKIPNGHIISRSEVIRRFPDVKRERLTGAAVFFDGLLLNPPRLVFEIVQSAIEAGAMAFNYCNATSIETHDADNRVSSVKARDAVTGKDYEFRTRSVINAAGPHAPWLPVSAQLPQRPVPFSRDMAFVVDRISSDPAALAVQTRYKDPDAVLTRGNRHLFMVPWRDYTLIGVNSRVFDEHPDSLDASEAEIADFIAEINDARPSLKLTRKDVRVVNAGLLPFGNNEAGDQDLSFGKRSLVTDHSKNRGPFGLVTAISVRWTMGRATAQAAVDKIEKQLRGQVTKCHTAKTQIRGSNHDGKIALRKSIGDDEHLGNLTPIQIDNVATNFGSNWVKVKQAAIENADMTEPVCGTSTLRGQVLIAAREEMVAGLADIILRRTDIGSGARPSDATLAECARIAAIELDWTDAKIQAEIESVKRLYPFYKSAATAVADRG
jgi:glycerol-3-phosphate dehydrogenase